MFQASRVKIISLDQFTTLCTNMNLFLDEPPSEEMTNDFQEFMSFTIVLLQRENHEVLYYILENESIYFICLIVCV